MTVTAAQVLLAGALDLAIGDPKWLPHPVRIMGKAIIALENLLRRFCSTPRAERIAGAALVLFVVAPVYLAGHAASRLLPGVEFLGAAILVYLIATTIASRELIGTVKSVMDSVHAGDLASGRQRVGMIVGRDTKQLDERGVLKAAIESLAENLSDGVVAPLFYLAIGGLPLSLAYKAVNTLDSMVGYRNERYRYVGAAAARLDDLANFIPARITGVLIIASTLLYRLASRNDRTTQAARAFSVMLRDGRNHPSPNSGVPEAAMAGALGIRVGGPSTYAGIVSEKPVINATGSNDYPAASRAALAIAVLTCVTATFAAAGVAMLRSSL